MKNKKTISDRVDTHEGHNKIKILEENRSTLSSGAGLKYDSFAYA